MTGFIYARTIHHYETDADGVCHFSNYLRIFEEALEHALIQSGYSASRLDHGFAVVEVKADYLQPLRHGDYFEVKFNFPQVKRSFLEARADISLGGKQCASIGAKLAAISRENNLSVSVNASLRRTLTQKEMEVL